MGAPVSLTRKLPTMLHATLPRLTTRNISSLTRGTLVRHLVTVVLVALMLVPATVPDSTVDAKARSHAARAKQEHARPKASRSEKKSDRKAKKAKSNKKKAKANKKQARQQKRRQANATAQQDASGGAGTQKRDGGSSRKNGKNKKSNKNNKQNKGKKHSSGKKDRRDKAQKQSKSATVGTES